MFMNNLDSQRTGCAGIWVEGLRRQKPNKNMQGKDQCLALHEYSGGGVTS